MLSAAGGGGGSGWLGMSSHQRKPQYPADKANAPHTNAVPNTGGQARTRDDVAAEAGAGAGERCRAKVMDADYH